MPAPTWLFTGIFSDPIDMNGKLPGLLMLGLAVMGCDNSRGFLARDEVDIKAMAAKWPPYRTPTMSDETLPARMRQPFGSYPQTGSGRPQLDSGIRVIKPYHKWTLTETAIDSLGRIGAAAVPKLVETLNHPDPRNRLQAALVLARIGPDADAAVPALLAAMQDRDERVRRAATRAIGQIGPAAEAAVDDLIAIVERGEEQAPDARQPARPRELPSREPQP